MVEGRMFALASDPEQMWGWRRLVWDERCGPMEMCSGGEAGSRRLSLRNGLPGWLAQRNRRSTGFSFTVCDSFNHIMMWSK